MKTCCDRNRCRGLILLAMCTAACVLFWQGCATKREVSHQAPDIEKLAAVVKQSPTVFPQPMERMSRVASEAMKSMDCTMTVETRVYLKGQLPTREFIEIVLKTAGESETQVWVDTTRTFVGGAWQANRNQEVLNVLKRQLERDLMLNP